MSNGSGMLVAKADEANQLVPPFKGWELKGRNGWISDPTLEVSSELSEPCREVIVELGGAAKEERPECEGSYLPVEGTVIRGRQVVFKSAVDHKHSVFSVAAERLFQAISPSWRLTLGDRPHHR